MTDLITIEEYKDALGIESTKGDRKVSSLITSVSALVKTYCGNSLVDFYSSDKIEKFTIHRNWNTTAVQLTETPLVSVTTVEERANYSSAYVEVPSTEYYADFSVDAIYRVTPTGNEYHWPVGPGSVKITYKAGYPECPADLQLAVVDLVTYYHKDEHKARQSIAGASVQNSSSSSQSNNVSFPDHIKRVLDLYKTI